MADTMRYMVCYDIPSNKRANKRRYKLVRCLVGYGDRVQKSVFEMVLTRQLFNQMFIEINQTINTKFDAVYIYPLCSSCANKVIRIGFDKPIPGEEKVFVV